MFKINVLPIVYLIVVSFAHPLLSAESEEDLHVTLLTDHFPPLTYQNKNGEFIGSADLIIKNLFNKANISYQTKSVPWKRAFRELDKNDTFLIYPLSRSKERETQYIWIAPLFHLEIKTYGLRKNYDNIDITQGDYRFVCIKTTINCRSVKSLNVPDSALSIISNISIKQLLKLVLRGHVDFFMSTESEFKHTIEYLNIDPELFVELSNYKYSVTDYLAANKNIDPEIVRRLKENLVSSPLTTK